MCPILQVQNNKVGGGGENVTTKPYQSYIQECAQDFHKGGTRMTLPPPIMPRGGVKLHLLLPHMCTPMLENFEGGGGRGQKGGGGGGKGPPMNVYVTK